MPDVVLLPGMLGDASVWDGVLARLGDGAAPHVGRVDLDGSVARIAERVLAEAPERFALVGHSLGGIVALEVVERAPGRVTRLALVASSGRAPSDAQRAAWDGWRERVEGGGSASVVRELSLLTLPESKRGDAALVARNAAMGETVGPAGLLRQLAAQQSRRDLVPSLGSVRAPTLVVSGELDLVSPRALQVELAAGIPGARHEVLAGVGHMVPLEAPEALGDLLRAWLAG